MIGRMRSETGRPVALLLDFDGTIAPTDLTEGTFEALGTGSWRREWRDLADRGLGSRGVLGGVIRFLPQDRDVLLAFALAVELDPAAAPLIRAATRAGWAVEVLSDGLGLYVPPMLKRAALDVPIRCADLVATDGRLEMVTPWACRASTGGGHGCATCKVNAVQDHRAAGRTVVMVGDGRSDRRAAAVADIVYATGFLAEHCDSLGIAHRTWTQLADVLDDLVDRGALPDAAGEPMPVAAGPSSLSPG